MIDRDTQDYRACVWLTKHAKAAAMEDVRNILYALTLGKEIKYAKGNWPQPGFEFAPHNKWRVWVGNCNAFGENKEQGECNLLGLLMKNGSGFPLFRQIMPMMIRDNLKEARDED